jgi:hypothetical protein
VLQRAPRHGVDDALEPLVLGRALLLRLEILLVAGGARGGLNLHGRLSVVPPGSTGCVRAWTLTQPWPRFWAIVRVVSGEALREELDDDDR